MYLLKRKRAEACFPSLLQLIHRSSSTNRNLPHSLHWLCCFLSYGYAWNDLFNPLLKDIQSMSNLITHNTVMTILVSAYMYLCKPSVAWISGRSNVILQFSAQKPLPPQGSPPDYPKQSPLPVLYAPWLPGHPSTNAQPGLHQQTLLNCRKHIQVYSRSLILLIQCEYLCLLIGVFKHLMKLQLMIGFTFAVLLLVFYISIILAVSFL